MEKNKILHHIKAMRIWLDKAEGWLEENNVVKAIATLLLASAEIQSPLKAYLVIKKEPQKIYRSTKIIARFAIAASFVLVMGTMGYLIINLSEKTKVITKVVEKPTKIIVQVPSTTTPAVTYRYIYKYPNKEEKEGLSLLKAQNQNNLVKIPMLTIEEKHPAEQKTTTAEGKEKIILTPEEITELVRLAEKSLKGAQ